MNRMLDNHHPRLRQQHSFHISPSRQEQHTLNIVVRQDLVNILVALPIARPVDDKAAERRRKKVYGLTILDLHQLHAVRARPARTPSLADRRAAGPRTRRGRRPIARSVDDDAVQRPLSVEACGTERRQRGHVVDLDNLA
jgi:hypothetical protein